MKRDRRFFAGLVGVGLVMTYLVWTGITDTMVYYLTPTELMARVEADPALHEVGFKVSGKVLPGSHVREESELLHRFVVLDTDDERVRLPVEFRHPLPDTFSEESEVVMEGRFRADGVFEATEVLTKCGSRYEAMPEGYGDDGPDAGGYGGDGYDAGGYGHDGYDAGGYGDDGYDAGGYRGDGYDAGGYGEGRYDADSHGEDGYRADGYDADGHGDSPGDRGSEGAADGSDRGGYDSGGEREGLSVGEEVPDA